MTSSPSADPIDPSEQKRALSKRNTPLFLGGPKLGTLWGVEIAADWSLLLIFALLTYNFGAGVLPRWHPEWEALVTWSTAVAAAFLFLVSILLHELCHAWVGRAQGIPIHRITLFLFGGVAQMDKEPSSAKAELLMAIVGPVCSAVIGIVATLAGSALAGPALAAVSSNDPATMLEAMTEVGPVATLLLWLGPVNILLALFNIIPGFPLDGGRVLRAGIWAATGDLTKATRWASALGRVLGWTLIALGLFSALSGALLSGVWLVLIGWFLSFAAAANYRQVLLREALEDVPVESVMRRQLTRVPPMLPLGELVTEHVMSTEQRSFPVESEGQLLGLISFDDIKRVPQARWVSTTVEAAMTPIERLATVPPGASAQTALQQLTTFDVNQVPVVEGQRLIGMIQRSDLLKWLDLRGHAGRHAPA